ncbi:MAG: hypothetical protein QGI24_00225 [Kiritimatiellia bacterium]|nr:hypothetical protein [Kiritimatiellia bacterium]MDP6847184.1 hypothetical protein [Kiritimatiellia bacterium]
MKQVVWSLVLFAALVSAGQETRITGIAFEGEHITCEVSTEHRFVGLEMAYDLNQNWLALSENTWNSTVSNGVCSLVDSGRLDYAELAIVFPKLSGMEKNRFYRARSSDEPLALPVVTNWICITNGANVAVSNVIVSMDGTISFIAFETNCLPPGTGNIRVPVADSITLEQFMTVIDECTCQMPEEWELRCEVLGTGATLRIPLIPFGTEPKEVAIVLRDDELDIDLDWLGIDATLTYDVLAITPLPSPCPIHNK